MIDQWLNKDLQPIWDQHPVAVLCDPNGEMEFLLKQLGESVAIHRPVDAIGELKTKYLIEKSQPSKAKTLIYARCRREDLRYLREYCETCGCLDLPHLAGYVKDHVHRSLNLHLNLPDHDLLTAAKISVGKDRSYWLDLCHKGAGEIFDLSKELLPFLHAPEDFDRSRYDAQIREAFYRRICEYLGQPYIKKPAQTLANELVKAMLDGLAEGRPSELMDGIYENWLDSVECRGSFGAYLSAYTLPDPLDPKVVAVNHPFKAVDEIWLAELADALEQGKDPKALVAKLRERANSQQARALGITFWKDVLTLVDFDPKDISFLNSLTECVEFYTKHFAPLDTAIRNLYARFLERKDLLAPWQSLYRDRVSLFLEQWFRYFSQYNENQTGLLQRLLESNTGKTAIIVGDGVAYEIACQVAAKVGSRYQLTKDIVFADLPSETENNMSRIYMDSGLTEKVQSEREKYLIAQNTDKSLGFIRLEDVNDEVRPEQYLIITYKEFDDLGEKLQQKALKHFGEAIEFLASKLRLLLDSGYEKVYLIADHGFVLTGILNESDKIIAGAPAHAHTAERYIQSDERLDGFTEMVEEERPQGKARYLYFSKNLNPFKTPGVYGFSHGGATPQEVITPLFCWQQGSSESGGLKITISNKKDLSGITGELFSLKLSGSTGRDDLFSRERRVYLLFFADGRQINKSDIFPVQAEATAQKEFAFDGHPRIEAQLLDAETKQLLDQVTIQQTKSRDLGGLL
jgi:hypothetical protein